MLYHIILYYSTLLYINGGLARAQWKTQADVSESGSCAAPAIRGQSTWTCTCARYDRANRGTHVLLFLVICIFVFFLCRQLSTRIDGLLNQACATRAETFVSAGGARKSHPRGACSVFQRCRGSQASRRPAHLTRPAVWPGRRGEQTSKSEKLTHYGAP